MQHISSSELQTWLTEDRVLLIDVREPEEFANEHIPQAISIPLAQLGGRVQELLKPCRRRIVFQCKGGIRGGKACSVSEDVMEGCQVWNLEGGIDAWKAAGLPTVSTALRRHLQDCQSCSRYR